jgi:hypothetical protein
MTGGWSASALDALGREVVLRRLGNLLLLLADEFPAFEFGTQRTWNGVSLVAVRRDGVDRAGTYAVVTSDPGEMRHVLTLESGRTSTRQTAPRRTPQPGPAEGTSCPVS